MRTLLRRWLGIAEIERKVAEDIQTLDARIDRAFTSINALSKYLLDATADRPQVQNALKVKMYNLLELLRDETP